MAITDQLCLDHLLEITTESAVSEEVALARGYRTLTGTAEDRQFLEDAGYSRAVWDRDDAYPMLLVPLHGADGGVNGYQVKPAVPRTRMNAHGELKPIKYETPKGAPLVVDIPAVSLERLRACDGTALWITEGAKKVDALVTIGAAPVGLTGVFNWRNRHGSLGDWEDVPIKGRPAVVCFDADAESNRNVQLAMARLGAWLKTRGASVVHYVVVPATVNDVAVKGVDDYLAAGGTLEGLFKAARAQAPGQGSSVDASFTDAYLVEEVCTSVLDDRFCWASGLGWLKWNGQVWTEVADTEPVEAVRLWAKSQYDAVLDESKRDPSRNLAGQISGWRGVLTRSRLRALADLARGIVERYAEDFDSNPDILTCQNGTLHLPTGTLRPFDPADSVTLMAGAEYRPGARHPLWDKALSALPADVVPWLQDRLGQSLTGYKTPDHVMVLSSGTGSNGKSTITNTVRKAIGRYGVQISDRVLMANPGDHPTELMDLRGARYAVLEETPEARHLNVQRLKMTLGTEEITARRIRQDSVTFKATHSMFVNTNYRPTVNETDHGTWRRLALLTYPWTFRKRQSEVVSETDRLGDPELEYAHDNPDVRAAALAWMAEGARAWYARGRRMADIPGRVEADTASWRAETDLILGFLTEYLTLDREAFTPAQELLTAFNDWSAERGHRPWNDKTFASRFGGHDTVLAAKVSQGRKYVEGRQVRGWHGVAVRKGDDPFDPGARPEPAPEAPQGPAPEPYQGPEIPALPERPAAKIVGFDLETAGVEQLFLGGHEGPYVRLCGWTDETGAKFQSADPAELLRVLNDAETLYAHRGFTFDLLALAYHCGADYDALAAKMQDTAVLAQLSEPPQARGKARLSYALDDVAKRLGHDGKSDDVKRLAAKHGGFDKIPVNDPEYVAYLDGDLDATRYVHERLQMLSGPGERSADERTIAYAEREMRVEAFKNRMTLNGWAVDLERLDAHVAGEAARVAEAKERLAVFGVPLRKPDRFKLLPKKDWPEDYRNELSVAAARKGLAEDPERSVEAGLAVRIPGEESASPWATDAGREALTRAFRAAGAEHVPQTANGVLKTSADALGEGTWYCPDRRKAIPGMLRVYGHLPGVRDLCETLALATGATAKYAEIRKYVTARGRVHALTGATQASGRWATTNPASANLGKRGEKVLQREVFTADDGHLLIACDGSQVDVRAVAGHCQDPALIAMLQPGRDYHSEMAEIFFGDRRRRKDGKPISHGRNYGQGARAIAERNGLDLLMVSQACVKQDQAMPVLYDWKREVAELAATGAPMDNGFGRMMQPDPARAATQGPALMGQGAARDIICESILRLIQLSEGRALPLLRGVVHDEVVLSVPEDETAEWAEMLQAAFTWEWRGVPILGDVSRPAFRWSDCYAD